MKNMFLGIFAVYLLGNVYVFAKGYRYICQLVNTNRGVYITIMVVYSLLFWFAAVSLFVSLFARNSSLPQSVLGAMYNIGSIWMVFTLYMVLALLVADLLGGLCRVAFFCRYGTPAAFFFVIALLLYGHINYKNPKIEEVTIVAEGAEKEDLQGKRAVKIVAVSDVHLGYATDKKSLQRYVQQINSLLPDIILIGGDLIDNSIVPLREQRMWEELGELKAPMGVYMVPGNHEYISGIDECEKFLKQTPIVLLRDSVVALPGGITLVGRDDRSNRERKGVEELLTSCISDSCAVASGLTVLLDHQPYEIALKDSLGVDIQFSGHTHRGQVWPMSLLVDRMYEQSYGYRKWSNSHVIVSSGLSLWGPPFRIGTNSDLWVINFNM